MRDPLRHAWFRIVTGVKLMKMFEGKRVVAVEDVLGDILRYAVDAESRGDSHGAAVLRDYAAWLSRAEVVEKL